MKPVAKLSFPLENREVLRDLKVGDFITLDGWLLCARDATHRKILSSLKDRSFSFDFHNQLIYYLGPTPAPPGMVIGSCGPTTASRMDIYLEEFLALGLAATMGKGKRASALRELHRQYQAVYLITFGGVGAYLSQFVQKMEYLAWKDLGPEALFRIKVKDFPAIVGIDTLGQDFYELSSALTPA
ncbi:MAG: FumA C-terminus/TtdB family hydratase beta subunit [Caldimicrobium sp.]|nr:FumA C-terminus/TtdB family hydratase beta subunit [Caldimicrobium sp.]MCX7612696.1 FumA C-terminus/TtdB family hydratase beta subunit [Caldimicrobium sp.]MDW8182444.1 FumA C-terminus/TtdB family hydratase beta subunit [Caldimicrobium sp.]